MPPHLDVCMYVYIYIYVCVYIYIYICISILPLEVYCLHRTQGGRCHKINTHAATLKADTRNAATKCMGRRDRGSDVDGWSQQLRCASLIRARKMMLGACLARHHHQRWASVQKASRTQSPAIGEGREERRKRKREKRETTYTHPTRTAGCRSRTRHTPSARMYLPRSRAQTPCLFPSHYPYHLPAPVTYWRKPQL